MTAVIRVQSKRLRICQYTPHGGGVTVSPYDYAGDNMSQGVTA